MGEEGGGFAMCVGLKVLEVGGRAVAGKELVVAALLDDAALGENEDAIGEAHATRKSESN